MIGHEKRKNLKSFKGRLLNVQSQQTAWEKEHSNCRPQNGNAIKGSNLEKVGRGTFLIRTLHHTPRCTSRPARVNICCVGVCVCKADAYVSVCVSGWRQRSVQMETHKHKQQHLAYELHHGSADRLMGPALLIRLK